MESVFFPKATRDTRGRQTIVILDMDDYSIPDGLTPNLIANKIRTALFDAGYRTSPTIRVFVAENPWSEEMLHNFRSRGIWVNTTCQGDRDLRLMKMLLNVLYSVWSWGASNVLILSNKHEKMKEDTQFSRFRKTLENRGCCVVAAKPHKPKHRCR